MAATVLEHRCLNDETCAFDILVLGNRIVPSSSLLPHHTDHFTVRGFWLKYLTEPTLRKPWKYAGLAVLDS